MPVKVVKRKNKYRIIDVETGRLTRNRAGTPVDGGGHFSYEKAVRQARAINASMNDKKRKHR